MAKFRWPTDPPGKAASHSISWQEHQRHLARRRRRATPRSPAPSPAPRRPAPAEPSLAPQPLPPDPGLEDARLSALRNIQLGAGESAWQQGQLQRDSGFDASGNLITAGADYNPFSQAMQLQDSWKQSKLGTTTGYAAQGQQNSGAYGRAQARNDRGYAMGYDALRTGTLAGYHGIQSGQLQTYASNALGAGSADFDSLYRRLYGG
jgi:hypothetical protein